MTRKHIRACTAHFDLVQELTSVRARFELGGAVLAEQGWALTGLRATDVKPARAPRGRPRAGAPAPRAHGARVTFALGRGGPGLEQLRLRCGDSVVLSASDPLSDAVGEGTLVGLSGSQASVLLEPGAAGGEMAAARWREHQGWRLDKGANHTSFKRQLGALLALVAPPPSRPVPRIFSLITAGEVAPAPHEPATGPHANLRPNLT